MAKTVVIEVLDGGSMPQILETLNSTRFPPGKERNQATYKPLSKDPLGTRRTVTDLIFNYLFVILLVTWLGVCLFGRREYKQITSFDIMMNFMQDFHYKGGFLFLVASLLITGLLIVGSLWILCRYSRKFVNFGWNTLHFTMALSIVIFIGIVINAAVQHPALIFLTLPCLLGIVINHSVISSIQLIGLDSIAEFMKKTCQSLLHCKFLILYGLFILLLESLITCFTYIIMDSLYESTAIVIAFFGGLYVGLSVLYFNQMVLAEVLATWHCKENGQHITRRVLWACIKTNTRFHFGSAALQATYVIPLCLSALAAIKSKIQSGSYTMLIARCVCTFRMILDVADCTSVETAIHGFDFYGATRRVHNLLIKHSILYLGVMTTVDVICVCLSIVLGTLSYILCQLFFLIFYPLIFEENSRYRAIQVAIFVEIALLLITAWLIMTTAMRTTLFCTLESHELEGIEKNECREGESSDAEASAPALAMFKDDGLQKKFTPY